MPTPAFFNTQRKAKHQTYLVQICLLLIGVALIVIGQLYGGKLKDIITPIGGVFFGGAISSFVAQILSPNPLDGVVSLLDSLVSMPWRNAEGHLSPFRKKFHGYLCTRASGKRLWLYRVFDFSSSQLNNHLSTTIEYINSANRHVRYRYYGFLAEERLFLVGLNVDVPNEPAVIHVFPNLGQETVYGGIAVLKTLKGEEILTASLLSEEPLVNIVQTGVVGEEAAKELDVRWRESFPNTVQLPP